MSRILVIEDNRNLASGLRTNFEHEGYEVEIAFDGSAGVVLARTGSHDLIVLDLMLPKMDGLRVLDTLRKEGIDVPLIVLTARGDEDTKVHALGLGADDYVTKPFGIRELLARVAAHLRRASLSATDDLSDAEPVQCGSIVVEPETHTVRRHGKAVKLRPKEYDLLLFLIRRAGRIATRAELLQAVWGYHESVQSRTLDTHIAALRRRIEDDPADPRRLLTVRQTGYRLISDDEPLA